MKKNNTAPDMKKNAEFSKEIETFMKRMLKKGVKMTVSWSSGDYDCHFTASHSHTQALGMMELGRTQIIEDIKSKSLSTTVQAFLNSFPSTAKKVVPAKKVQFAAKPGHA